MNLWRAFVTLLLMVVPVVAEDLPKELLLQCEGKMNATFDGPRSQSRDASIRFNILLKDGSVTDPATGIVEGTGCVSDNSEIKCEATKLYPQPNSVIKRFSTVVINRTTREVTLWLESWDYQGEEASGTPSAHLRVLRTGVCPEKTLF